MYISFVTEYNKNLYVARWLLLITFLVSIMIVVGGLTRLTDSGLSITKWDLVSGLIPPLNEKAWIESFSLYKEIPEYILENSSMTLDEFKYIYWWEYAHRILGRIIGLFYLLPLLYFTVIKVIKKDFILPFYSILLLILLQGFVGWYMVKSGLTENTDVSHYRLSLHLTLAFIILICLFWSYLKINYQKTEKVFKSIPFNLPSIFVILLLLQISVGALVSGLDAGQIYQTWPLMNDAYYPDDSKIKDLFSLVALETPSLVQFIHRNIAYLIIFLFLWIVTLVYKNDVYNHLKKTTQVVFIFLSIQIFLGVFTVISGAQIILASMHQIGSIFLITSSLVLVFKNSTN
jgi:heme a synthase